LLLGISSLALPGRGLRLAWRALDHPAGSSWSVDTPGTASACGQSCKTRSCPPVPAGADVMRDEW